MGKEVIFSEGDFTFVKTSGVGLKETPWEGLEVISSGKAEKYKVSIQLDSLLLPRFDGRPVNYTYNKVYVDHGVRDTYDTFVETKEYIEVLQKALIFAIKINNWLNQNPKWKDWVDCL